MSEVKHSLKWVFIWMLIASAFGTGIYFLEGSSKCLEFFAGYLIEFSLSMDNLFVFISIFMAYGIVEHAQHRVLNYGIIGAIILRFIFIFAGIAIVNALEWILYIFGVILIINGIKMWKEEEEKDPHDSRIIRGISRVLPMTRDMHGEKFIITENGKRLFTPLFAILCLVEFSDIIFAVDSVPAVFSVSKDPFIVYSSNIFAILGLRQLFFVVEHMRRKFEYVRYGVGIILIFTGIKLLALIFHVEISIPVSIGFIFGVLVLSIIISVILAGKKEKRQK